MHQSFTSNCLPYFVGNNRGERRDYWRFWPAKYSTGPAQRVQTVCARQVALSSLLVGKPKGFSLNQKLTFNIGDIWNEKQDE
jgi:hypothetical protein